MPRKANGQEWRVRMRAQAAVFEAEGKRTAADFLHRRVIADARLEAALCPVDDRKLKTEEHR